MSAAITFDFHNTLIRCEAWFDLEVRELPAKVLVELESLGVLNRGEVDPTLLTAEYRGLRSEVIAHGNESDAEAGVRESFRRAGFPIDSVPLQSIIDPMFRSLVGATILVDGAVDAVAYLADFGVPIAVISSAIHHEFLEWALDYHNIRDQFTGVFTSASTGFYKSRPEIYRHSLESIGAEPEQTIHVGDSFRFDHLGGRAAGVRTVWLNELGESPPPTSVAPNLELRTLVGAGPVLLSMIAETTGD